METATEEIRRSAKAFLDEPCMQTPLPQSPLRTSQYAQEHLHQLYGVVWHPAIMFCIAQLRHYSWALKASCHGAASLRKIKEMLLTVLLIVCARQGEAQASSPQGGFCSPAPSFGQCNHNGHNLECGNTSES